MGSGVPMCLFLILVTIFCGGGATAPREMVELRGRLDLEITTFTANNGLGFAYTRSRGKCSPQFWSSRMEAWPKMVPQTSSVSKIFGSQAAERYRWDLTLVEAAEWNDGGGDAFARLLKHSTAALLNSYSRRGYPYSAWEVKTLFLQALVSDQAASRMADLFAAANHECE